MIKILNTKQIREWDAFTIKKEPVASIDLMERACVAFVQWFDQQECFLKVKKIGCICGTGNNGGDGLGIARLLSNLGYGVSVWIVQGGAPESEDFKINKARLPKKVKCIELALQSDQTMPDFCDVFIDAIFGSGLSKPVEGLYEKVVHRINSTSNFRIAIDVPSGLYMQSHSNETVVRATHTVTFQAPKLAFMMPENEAYVGEWTAIDIGLKKRYLDKAVVHHFLTTRKSARKLLLKRARFSHKGTFGHALLVAGSYGKMGACILATRGALRSGLGLLTVHVPEKGYEIIQRSVPEAIVSVDENDMCFTSCPNTTPYDVLTVGPGLGQDGRTVQALKDIFHQVSRPVILDADALNILASNRKMMDLIPENSILTPHPGELRRLVGVWKDDFDRLEKAMALAIQIGSIIVLKGAYTAVCCPEGNVYFNPTGNPGMATGGSGDGLTGILTGLLAQRLAPLDAAVLGVYIHGLAGDMAADIQGEYGLIASDIIDFIPKAFKELSYPPHKSKFLAQAKRDN